YSFGVQLVLLVMNGYAAWKIADTIGWRLYFVVQASQMVLLYAMLYFLTSWQSVTSGSARYLPFVLLQYLPLVLLVMAAIGDGISRRTRDWPHWVGVVLPCAVHISYLCNTLFR